MQISVAHNERNIVGLTIMCGTKVKRRKGLKAASMGKEAKEKGKRWGRMEERRRKKEKREEKERGEGKDIPPGLLLAEALIRLHWAAVLKSAPRRPTGVLRRPVLSGAFRAVCLCVKLSVS